MNIQDFIKLGVCEDVNELIERDPLGKSLNELNLGAGKKLIGTSLPLDLPGWNADTDLIPAEDDSIAGIWMIHMLEHVELPIKLLRDCQRVLIYGGFVNIVVPYYNSNMNAQELDHKHNFSEETFPALFRQKQYYEKNLEGFEWEFDINLNLIIGAKERNMCLYVQLIKRRQS